MDVPPSIDDLVRLVAPRIGETLVATDFDGTLAPLVVDPESSQPVPGAVDALAELSRHGAQVAVITGRDAGTAVRLGGLEAVPGIVVEGLYGAEQWSDGTLTTPDTPEAVETLRARLPALLRDGGVDPDVWIEDKRLSLVVHARRVADPDAELAKVDAPLRRLAAELDVEVHPGAQVLELRLPGFDKAGALERLTGRHSPGVVLYLGDDLGDLPAFAEIVRLRDRGLLAVGIAVTDSGVDEVVDAADLTLPDPTAVVGFYRALTGG